VFHCPPPDRILMAHRLRRHADTVETLKERSAPMGFIVREWAYPKITRHVFVSSFLWNRFGGMGYKTFPGHHTRDSSSSTHQSTSLSLHFCSLLSLLFFLTFILLLKGSHSISGSISLSFCCLPGWSPGSSTPAPAPYILRAFSFLQPLCLASGRPYWVASYYRSLSAICFWKTYS
jgi:hypothetical protein